MSRMLESSGAAALATFISRVLGFVRVWSYALFMGTGPVADAFTAAFQIPNLFRRLLGEGALTAAFIPIFKAKEHEGTEEELWRATNAVLSAVAIVCVGFCLLAVGVLTVVLRHAELNVHHQLVLQLMRVMLPYVPMVCLTAVLISILNSRGWFFLPALGAAMLNIVMVASVYLLAPRFGASLDQQIFGLAVGVILAGVVQVTFQLPALWREGYRVRWVAPWNHPIVGEVARKMAPATLGVAAYQINVMLTNILALGAGPHIVSSFEFAVRLMELPQGVAGLSLATVVFTELSRLAVEKNFPQFRATLAEGIRNLLFVNAIASVLLLALAEPIMRLCFQYGTRFDADSTARAGLALTCLAPGLMVFSLNNLLARAFYALGDTGTPMKISVVSLGLNLVLAAVMLPLLRQGALGTANTMSGCINSALLIYALKRKLPKMELRPLGMALLGVMGPAVAAGLGAWGARWVWTAKVGHGPVWQRAGEVFLPAAIGGAIYFGISWWTGMPQARDVAAMVRRRLAKKSEGDEE